MKRILATVISVMLIATLALSGTIAYLTDDESAINVMTVGKVNVKLWEQQRELDKYDNPSHNGKLEDFEDNKDLVPITNDGTSNDSWGLSTETNYVDKIVRVENIGESDAWVRVFVAVPSELEDVNGSGKAALHWNFGWEDPATTTKIEYSDFEDAEHPLADFTTEFGTPETVAEDFPIDNINYNIYCFTRKQPLAAYPGVNDDGDPVDDWTAAVMVGFYLDPAVDFSDKVDPNSNPYYPYYLGDKNDPANTNNIKFNLDEHVKIPVFVQAIQAEGFESAALAFNGLDEKNDAIPGNNGVDDNMPGNPWAIDGGASGTLPDESTEDDKFTSPDDPVDPNAPVKVSTSQQLQEAISQNKNIELTGNITLANDFVPYGDKDMGVFFTGSIDGKHHTISGLKVESGDYVGFINAMKGGTIKNLTVEGSVSGTNAAGIVARMDGGTIENCTSRVTVTGTTKAGGIVCMANPTSDGGACVIKGCENTGSVTGGAKGGFGGIVGQINLGTSIIDCKNSGNIVSNTNASDSNVGGIVGTAANTNNSGNASATGTISGCSNSGNISGYTAAGGIAGSVRGSSYTISGCTNSSNSITGTGNLGSIAGYIQNANTVDASCKDEGNTGLQLSGSTPST